jgi:serine/threonine-protein kinase
MARARRSERDQKPIKVVGRYALFDRVAVGGMAAVHLGRLVGAAGFSRTVAIKRLRRTYARDPKFVEMFIDEARVAARIRHPNVAATIDVVSDDDELLLVLEYVHGESLSKLMAHEASRQGIEPRIAVAIAVGALHGLHAAHEARSEKGARLGIIHRDVSPQNILVGADGVPRVVDFGIAKAQNRNQRTEDGHVKGKPRYMAPEQLQGEQVQIDHRVDIFSMGTVLWEALTGRKLFDHENFIGVLNQILDMPIRPPHEVNPRIARQLSTTVTRALSRDRETRFQTALEFAVALEKAASPMATQHALGAWVQERASEVLTTRQGMIEVIENFELSLGDRTSSIDDSSFFDEGDEDRDRASDVAPGAPSPQPSEATDVSTEITAQSTVKVVRAEDLVDEAPPALPERPSVDVDDLIATSKRPVVDLEAMGIVMPEDGSLPEAPERDSLSNSPPAGREFKRIEVPARASPFGVGGLGFGGLGLGGAGRVEPSSGGDGISLRLPASAAAPARIVTTRPPRLRKRRLALLTAALVFLAAAVVALLMWLLGD